MGVIYTLAIGYIGHKTWPKSGKCRSNVFVVGSKSGVARHSVNSYKYCIPELPSGVVGSVDVWQVVDKYRIIVKVLRGTLLSAHTLVNENGVKLPSIMMLQDNIDNKLLDKVEINRICRVVLNAPFILAENSILEIRC